MQLKPYFPRTINLRFFSLRLKYLRFSLGRGYRVRCGALFSRARGPFIQVCDSVHVRVVALTGRVATDERRQVSAPAGRESARHRVVDRDAVIFVVHRGECSRVARTVEGKTIAPDRRIFVAMRLKAARVGGDLRAAGNERAPACLEDDLNRCLTFYQFAEAHWSHLRTTNVIESLFTSVRLRTNAAKRFKKTKSGVYLVYGVLLRLQQNSRWMKSAQLRANVPAPQSRLQPEASVA